PSGKNIIRWLLKKRTNGSVRYCQYTSLGTSYKSGMGIDQKIVKDTSTNKGKAKQTLNFKAWLVGAADAPDLGNFEANTTFQITYL
ncbi:hypothetical protein, partial [Escherichia coli]|uniref:hypothetical protein n=1 Tax=Escherichia coli TaxID=562 RepID=UPI0020751F93